MPRLTWRAYHLAAVATLIVSAGTARAAVQDVHTHRFDHGLVLHVAPGHASPVASVQAWVGVGSADEGPTEAGLAHAVEHMLFKGSSGYGRGELVGAIERGGGEINAFTAFDHTVYHAVLGSEHVETALEAMGDALIAPRVDPVELARERQVILQEIRQRAEDPSRSVAQSLFATAYVAHPYRRPVIGTSESVSRISERELVDFFRSYYVADNLTLVVAGDVDPVRIRRSVERRFRAMPSGRRQRCVATEPMQTAPRASCTYRDVAEAHVAVGFHVPAVRHPDLAALDVAAILLGQSESARLPRVLRDREGLVTSADANVHALRDPGLLVLSATTARASDAVNSAGALVEHALAAIGEIGPDELEVARTTAESAFVRQLETAQGRARSLGWYATTAGDPQFGHVYLDRIRAVRTHDLVSAVRRYVRPDNASIAAVLPPPARARANGPQVFARRAELRVRKSVATGPAAAPTAPVEKRIVLGNGMVVLVRRDPSVPVVAMRGVWRGGVRAEDDAHAGTSSLLAQLITRGCGTRDATAVAEQIDRLGGALGGVAGRNSFGVASEWLARTWQAGFELMADCILTPQLTDEELTRTRTQLGADLAAQSDTSSQMAFRLFADARFGAHPYARDATATIAALSKLSRADVTKFYADHYPVSTLTLAIVGDVDIDEAIAAVKARFDAVPASTAVAPPAITSTAPTGAKEVYQFVERDQAHLVIGFPGTTLDAPDRFALEVLVAIMGGQGGRLFAELREQQALVYRVSMHSVEGVDPGFVAVYLSCAPDKLPAAVAAVKAELARVRTDGITADELARAQAHLVGSHQIAMQRRSAIANAMAYHESYNLGWQSWTGYAASIRAVDATAVKTAAQTFLRDDRMITATVEPPKATPGAAKRTRGKRPAPKAKSPMRRMSTRPRSSV